MSVFTRCGWSVFTKDGLADQVPILARLTIARDLSAWTWGSEEWNPRVVPWLTEEEQLVSIGDLSTEWSPETAVESLGPFGKLLLMACRGQDDPRLLA